MLQTCDHLQARDIVSRVGVRRQEDAIDIVWQVLMWVSLSDKNVAERTVYVDLLDEAYSTITNPEDD